MKMRVTLWVGIALGVTLLVAYATFTALEWLLRRTSGR